jgi:general secretion pathway protein D
MLQKTILSLLAGSLLFLGGCTAGRSLYSRGEELASTGNLDEAVLKYAEAMRKNPESSEYRMAFLTASEKSAQVHIKKADGLYDEGEFDAALREYQSAQSLDPSLKRASQKVQLLTKLHDSDLYMREGREFEKNNKPKEAYRSYKQALSIYPDNKDAKAAYDRLRQSKRTKMDGFELNLKSNKPITLKFKDARTRDVFSILSQLSGINFIFDDTVKDQNITIFLENASFQQAMDVITNLSKLGKKVLNESTIILYPRTPDKTKQYDELVVKTMYLTTLEAKKAVNLLRTMLQLKKIYVNEDLNALVIRDTPEMVDVAQKIIDANDIPEAEVLLDIEVLQLSKNDQVNFGLALSRYAVSVAATSPNSQFLSDTLSGATTSSTTTGSTVTPTTVDNLLQVFRWNGYGSFMTVPSATYNFGKNISNGEVLSNPKVRVKNREKSKFNVGQRVPITTTSTTGAVGGTNVNVQYVDVGVKVNAEPTIQLNNEITIKLSLEVSNILSQATVGGKDSLTTVVTIGTRNVDTVLNLKDGETSIIGGLLEDSVNKSKQKIWLLGDIPIIGPMLSNSNDTKSKSELVLAITPRIVRALVVPDSDVSSFWSGREDEPSATNPYLIFAPEPDFDKTESFAPAPRESGAAPAPAAPSPRRTAPPTSAPAVIERGSMSLDVPATVAAGQQFTVEVKADGVKELYSAPFTLIYDPLFAEYVGATEAGFLKQDGKPTTFSAVNDSSGKVAITLHRVGDVGGITGNGILLKATFKAKNAGPLNLGFSGVNFATAAGKNLPMVPYNVLVDVK